MRDHDKHVAGDLRRGFLTSTALCGLLIAMPAAAQTLPQGASEVAAQTESGSEPEESVVITGSRIANPNLGSASPVTVVGQEEFAATGTARIEDLINSLPQVTADQTGSGAQGIATVDLRGIGPSRTLVLVNGRRLVPGDPENPVADLNNIPAALIERVEVLTGGASSVYGSDAIAGVVNFVLDKDFDGFRIDSQYSVNQHDNDGDQRILDALNQRGISYPTGSTVGGAQFDVNLTTGAGFDDGRGHVTAYAGYRKIQGLRQAEYDFSSCSLTPSTTTDTFACSGSPTTSPAQFQISRNPDAFNPALTNTTAQTLNPAVTNGAGFRAYDAARDAYNFAPATYYQRPDERFTAGAFADYEISDAIHPYLELSFMDDRSVYQQGESGAFGTAYSIPCDGSNPLISAAQLAVACTPARLAAVADNPATPLVNETRVAQTSVTALAYRRNSEGGGRQSDMRHTSYRVVLGTKGDLGSNWAYDVYGQFGRTVYSQRYGREFSKMRLQRALDVVRNPTTGAPVCRSVLNGQDLSCVPYDIYRLNGVTEAQLNYLQVPQLAQGQTTEQIVSASISNGDLGFGLPWAEHGVAFALGAEYRKESIELNTDLSFTLGDGAGSGGPRPSFTGGFDVKELFGELRVPIIEQSFIEELSLEAGYRYSDYSTSGTAESYKALLNFAPVDGIRFRGGYNRAVRAPNIVELYDPQRLGLFGGDDPCDGTLDAAVAANRPRFTLAQCQNTGVTAAQYGNIPLNTANQFQQFTGGNLDLEPEVADTYTAGVVFMPNGMLRGLNLSVDYYDIEVTNLIGTIGAQIILNQCAETGNPTFCGYITRDASGSLFQQDTGRVLNTRVNIGGVRTKGIDVSANYRLRLGGDLGSISASLNGTYLDSYVTTPGVVDIASGISTYDCAGFYGTSCDRPQPKWRHNLRLIYDPSDLWSITGRWRYFASSDSERTQTDNPFLRNTIQIPTAHISPYSYFDLSASVTPAPEFTLRMGVQNMFDKDPPAGNVYAGTYQHLGRYFHVGATLEF